MKAPLRSHGFDKPSDLDDELAELVEEAEAVAAEETVEKTAARRTPAANTVDPALRAELDELRQQVEKIRRDVKRRASNEAFDRSEDDSVDGNKGRKPRKRDRAGV